MESSSHMSHSIDQENEPMFFTETMSNVQLHVSQLNKTNHQMQRWKWLFVSTQTEKPSQDLFLRNHFDSPFSRQIQKVVTEYQGTFLSCCVSTQHCVCSYITNLPVHLAELQARAYLNRKFLSAGCLCQDESVLLQGRSKGCRVRSASACVLNVDILSLLALNLTFQRPMDIYMQWFGL